ncbi:hypothetical protein [Stratiformator vulcanicus]|uniref:Uncharacterized protein n=1 Tax=Stratiformator vulcanicus TaxID=2527980 RepID=A0A517R3X8_9PLAN|nr:hypothetical protein [Stratiformator vulcanicus]QDT38557.1 hypothetical protein Pan189_29520 [Stratiformator vulcanicus]
MNLLNPPSKHRQFAAYAVLMSLALSGCASSRFGTPFAGRDERPKSLAAEASPDDSDSAEASAEPDAIELTGADSPFKPEKSGGATAAQEIADLATDGDFSELVKSELDQASDAERQQLITEWKKLDEPAVRQLIRIRRMVRQMQDSESTGIADGSFPATPTAGDHIQLAGGEFPGRIDDGFSTAGQFRSDPLVTPAVVEEPKAERDGIAFADPQVRPAGNRQPENQGFGHSIIAGGPIGFTNRLLGRGSSAEKSPSPAPAPLPVDAAEMPPIELSPASGSSRSDWDNEIDQLIALAEERAETARTRYLEAESGLQETGDPSAIKAEYVKAQVDLRMLYMMAGNQSRAVLAVPGIESSEQEFWQQAIWGMVNYFDTRTMPDHADRATQAVSQFRKAASHLQGKARLELRNLSFCHKIASFGNYERFERDEFNPGQRLLLYCEVKNFASKTQPADGMYRTQLKSRIEIYRSGNGGPLVHEIDFPETVDLCRSQRQDYFHSYELKVPQKLALGPHILKLTITDTLSGKVTTDSANFTVR